MDKGFLFQWRRAVGTKSMESAKTPLFQNNRTFMRFLPVLVFFAFGLVMGCGGGGGDSVFAETMVDGNVSGWRKQKAFGLLP